MKIYSHIIPFFHHSDINDSEAPASGSSRYTSVSKASMKKELNTKMELLPSGQQNAVEVLWEDQQKINKFSSLIYKKDTLTERLEKLKTEKEYIDDLAIEIELLDEEEKIQYKIGDAFVFLKVEAAVEAINKQNDTLDASISELVDQIEEIEEQLAVYKKELYAKFGNNIQLER